MSLKFIVDDVLNCIHAIFNVQVDHNGRNIIKPVAIGIKLIATKVL